MAATPAVVAQRMTDLLQNFPAAAIAGVQWSTLVRKYEEKHGAALNLASLGHSSALAAATALLFDVIRIVDKSDTDNPVVAVEDAIALTPSPCSLASWPSLYKVLCDIACNHGSFESTVDECSYVILLSQVKPLLQRHWHSNFDELGLAYFTEEGSIIKLKKMKHLLQALLRWRSQRINWKVSMEASGYSTGFHTTRPNELDAALEMELLLVPSKTHNDLILKCVCSQSHCAPAVSPATPQSQPSIQRRETSERWADITDGEEASTESEQEPLTPSSRSVSGISCTSGGSSTNLEQELSFLRSENAKLRCENHVLESRANLNTSFSDIDFSKCQTPTFDMCEDFDLDDPSEPPPYRYWSPNCSTTGSVGFGSGSLTPFSVSSGCASPLPATAGQMPKGFQMPMMPVWFQIIPTGVVEEARAMFGGTTVPSWFANQQ